MRACVLVLIVMFAIWIKRPNQPINTLSLAAIMVMLAINPEYVFSIGVQLVVPGGGHFAAVRTATRRRQRQESDRQSNKNSSCRSAD